MSQGDGEAIASFIWLGLFGVLLIAVGVFAFFLLPVVLIAGAMFGGVYYYYHSPGYKEEKAREHTYALYEKAKAHFGGALDKESFLIRLVGALPPMPDKIKLQMLGIAETLYQVEGFTALRRPPPVCNSIEGARYRDYLSAQMAKENTEASGIAVECLACAFRLFATELPGDDDSPFMVPLSDLVSFDGEKLEEFIGCFYSEDAMQLGLFTKLRAQFDANAEEADALPSAYKGDNAIFQYFKDTPFLDLFDTRVAFSIPENVRFEHHWIVSPPGTGKSTTLQCLIDRDFERVARGEASVIVMESNRDLVKAIEGLERFGPDGDLDGKLVLIDCEDVEWPIALNLFDVGLDDMEASPRDREALFNSAVAMLDYVFRALLGAELTSRQSTLFNFAIQLLIEIPGATLDTLIDIMSVRQLGPFEEYLKNLHPDAQQFFELKFFSKEFEQTKAQVTDRIFAVKRIRTLSRMFSAERTKLDLYREMGEGKVILINCAKSLLQEEGVEIVSRFFLAMILLAAEKRQLLSQQERLPTYVYIDECQDVIRRDEKLPVILDQARKFRVAMILAHQRLDQMEPPVLSALYGSTAIKFAAQLYDTSLARHMNTRAEFIRDQEQYSYAAFVRGTTKSALSLRIPHTDMSTMPRMSDQDHERIRDEMRARYAFQPKAPAKEAETETAEAVPELASPAEKKVESTEEIRPSDEL